VWRKEALRKDFHDPERELFKNAAISRRDAPVRRRWNEQKEEKKTPRS